MREHRCDLVHAHGRAPAWSGYIAARMTGVPFLTTWYKGFREQNALKRLYNGVMARGDRVIAVSDQLAELINDRYGTPLSRIAVIPLSIDTARFDPATVRASASPRCGAPGASPKPTASFWWSGACCAARATTWWSRRRSRLKAMGLKDFVFVFAAEDQGTRYAAELWDQVHRQRAPTT